MIYRKAGTKDYVLQTPESRLVAMYEFNLSKDTEVKITEIFYGKERPEVIVHTLENGEWSHINYISFEVYTDMYNKIMGFIHNEGVLPLLDSIDLNTVVTRT